MALKSGTPLVLQVISVFEGAGVLLVPSWVQLDNKLKATMVIVLLIMMVHLKCPGGRTQPAPSRVEMWYSREHKWVIRAQVYSIRRTLREFLSDLALALGPGHD